MSDRLGAPELDAIEQRVALASPGPWAMYNGWGPSERDGFHRVLFIGNDAERIFDAWFNLAAADIRGCIEDFEFTAHAREDVPRLIVALREALVALEPFAAVGADIPKEIEDEASIAHLPDISVGEWREAARVLEGLADV